MEEMNGMMGGSMGGSMDDLMVTTTVMPEPMPATPDPMPTMSDSMPPSGPMLTPVAPQITAAEATSTSGFRQFDDLRIAISTPDKKVRKSVLDLTQEEKKAYTDAVLAAKRYFLPGSTISELDKFMLLHVEIMAFARMPQPPGGDGGGLGMPMMGGGSGPLAESGINAAHFAPAFASWHRELLSRYEKVLQTASGNPNITVPYWEFTDPRTLDVIFSPDFLGGNGQGRDYTIVPNQQFVNAPTQTVVGGEVLNGPFTKANGYVLDPRIHTEMTDSISRGDALVRYLYNAPWGRNLIPKAEIDALMKLEDPSLFISAVEGNIKILSDSAGNLLRDANGNVRYDTPIQNLIYYGHNYIHDFVAGSGLGADFPRYLGTMNVSASPYDPVFWMLHSNIDRLWAEWQANGHNGPQWHATYNPFDPPGTPLVYGQNLDDLMWPWDGGQNMPRYTLADVPGMPRVDLRAFVQDNYGGQIVRLRDPIDLSSGRYDYTYSSMAMKASSLPDFNSSALFNAQYYLKANPDVAAAVNSGAFSSAYEHFSRLGISEGRNPSALFATYGQQNSDIAAAIANGTFRSGLDHYLRVGYREGRELTKQLAGLEEVYRFQNQDVVQAVSSGTFRSGIEHLMRRGLGEGRNPFGLYELFAESFDPRYYEARNPDVAAAVQQGGYLSSIQHFFRAGMFEGRDPSFIFNNSAYSVQNPDVAGAIRNGIFRSGFEHLLRTGLSEGRLTVVGGANSIRRGRTIIGTAGDDVITGGFGNDLLNAGAGDDLLDGGSGNDALAGGEGRDWFVLSGGNGMETIADFVAGTDRLALAGGLMFGDLAIAQGTGADAQNTTIRVAATGEMLATLIGTPVSSIVAPAFAMA